MIRATTNRVARWAAVIPVVACIALLAGCGGGGGGSTGPAGAPPEVVIGERLFRETRFAQFFAANVGNDVNVTPPPADPVLATTLTTTGTLPGAITGPTMSCLGCHLHTEGAAFPSGGLRTFSDYARRSPIPFRNDGATQTIRNSPPLVGALAVRPGPMLLHFDGEFVTGDALVRATLLGRNFGWLIGEEAAAKAHIARITREDDGTGGLAVATAGRSYAELLRAAPGVPAPLVLPAAFRVDASVASDDAILDAVAALIDAFLESMDFGRDAGGELDRSPYDLFLARNGLPRRPDAGESDLAYSRRLRSDVDALTNPVFVTQADGSFPVPFPIPFLVFEFGPAQFQGLRIFLAEPATSPPSATEIAQGGVGNCIACHQGPLFTDFLAHNVGVTQAEYDGLHGEGTFLALAIPDLATRAANPDLYLPASPAHPTAQGIFRRVPDSTNALFTDLGVWNVFANPDITAPQAALTSVLELVYGLAPGSMSQDALLPLTVAAFKTPGLRSPTLGGPYFHHGAAQLLEDVSTHYRVFGAKARSGLVRNPDPELLDIALVDADVSPLAAFMRSLNEDFQ